MPNPICPTGTTYVPGGRFKYGTKVKDMCIDVKPVSNKAYNKFLVGTKRTVSSRRARKPLAPVVNVSYNNARKYCQSMGMRILTMKEWEWAFVTSRYILSMGMKNQSGKTLREIVTTLEIVKGVRTLLGAAIMGMGKPHATSSAFMTSYVVGARRPTPSPIPRATITFRCAVESKTTQGK